MNNKVVVRECAEYDYNEVYKNISEIYKTCDGPSVRGKKVLVKPNILTDNNPDRCISTHPVVVEAMVKYLQDSGAEVCIGDSPAVHTGRFKGEKAGIKGVCDRTGAEWVDFTKNPVEVKLGRRKIKVASVINDVDLIISLPKFKNHELMYFTGAIKNTLGIVPGLNKAKQHALHQDRAMFGEFLVDLNEAVLPHFFIMDGIMGMEGPGPGNGNPYNVGVLTGSSNPLALDIIASTIAGYDPMVIPTNISSLKRGKWLKSRDNIDYSGPELSTLVRHDFKRIPVTGNTNIAIKFIMRRVSFLRRLERRPVFIHENCIGCAKCIKICPHKAIVLHNRKKNHVVLTDSKCIRCFCCSEVCPENAIDIRRKIF
jgi:uncharacterized protein (DUF362 family)/Pyruvate/2-oxoacid:ferredoxin oxidoreductase delta subunit